MGSGCSSVGIAVASDARGPRFESRHRQKLILNVYCQLYWKDENKEKEAAICPFKNTCFLMDSITCPPHGALYWKEMKAHINPSFCVYEMPNQFAKDNNQNCLTIGPVAFFYYRAKCTTWGSLNKVCQCNIFSKFKANGERRSCDVPLPERNRPKWKNRRPSQRCSFEIDSTRKWDAPTSDWKRSDARQTLAAEPSNGTKSFRPAKHHSQRRHGLLRRCDRKGKAIETRVRKQHSLWKKRKKFLERFCSAKRWNHPV